MKILITGSDGFIGKNLVKRLECGGNHEICRYDHKTDRSVLEKACENCDFVFHLAGVNRPQREEEFHKVNYGLTAELLFLLEKNRNTCPVMLASSIQAKQNTPYGISKKEGEEALKEYGARTGARILIYRFPNVFGKWCRPDYNSVIATFCHHIARNMPVSVKDETARLNLIYIDDLTDELLRALEGEPNLGKDGFGSVNPVYTAVLGEIEDLIRSYHISRETLLIPDMTEGSFSKKLYSTYLSYLPENSFKYPLKMNADHRGTFTEILRTGDRGQFSVNISKPGIVKGNHWHNTKCEKFLVVYGKALIRLRRPDSQDIITYHVTGDKLEVVDIPCGYIHSIANEGESDLITFMWCNECFNPDRPDTMSGESAPF